MKIDKKNGVCCYNDETHTYWHEKDNDKYISVTTLIGMFEAKFDKDFWSSYKALEAIIGKEMFALEKSRLLKTKRFDPALLELYNIEPETFSEAKQSILQEWETTNKESCERGTKIHAELESKYYKGEKHDLTKFGLGGKFYCRKNTMDFVEEKQVLPEYLIYRESDDGILKIAGQIDLLIKDGKDFYIVDYKTNKEIKTKSGFDVGSRKNTMMNYPLNNLMDCNYNHYTLQLSTYAWMIQKLNPEYNIKGLILIHYDHKGNVTTYQLDYLKDDVERMLAYYKGLRKKEISKEKRKKMEY